VLRIFWFKVPGLSLLRYGADSNSVGAHPADSF
jgi:hypothetical protein